MNHHRACLRAPSLRYWQSRLKLVAVVVSAIFLAVVVVSLRFFSAVEGRARETTAVGCVVAVLGSCGYVDSSRACNSTPLPVRLLFPNPNLQST